MDNFYTKNPSDSIIMVYTSCSFRRETDLFNSQADASRSYGTIISGMSNISVSPSIQFLQDETKFIHSLTASPFVWILVVPFISVEVMWACSVLGLVYWSSRSCRGVADENMGFSDSLSLLALPPI